MNEEIKDREKKKRSSRLLLITAMAIAMVSIYSISYPIAFGAEVDMPYSAEGSAFPGKITNVVTKQPHAWKYVDMGDNQIHDYKPMVYFTKSPTEITWNEPLMIDYVQKLNFDENQVKQGSETIERKDITKDSPTGKTGRIELKEKGIYEFVLNKFLKQEGNHYYYDTFSFYIYVDGEVATEQSNTTSYQSTAEVAEIFIADLEYGGFKVRITNPTKQKDRGTIALVGVNISEDLLNEGDVFFIDYELEAGESRDYMINTKGALLNMAMKDPSTSNSKFEQGYIQITQGSEIAKLLKAKLVTFESDADRDAFRATIPVEKIQENRNPGDSDLICNGKPGTEWLQKYMNITRKTIYMEDHSVCGK